MPVFAEDDRALIECLHQLVFADDECNAAIDEGLRKAAGRFAEPQYAKAYSSVAVPIALFTAKLPEPLRERVRLCRAFTIKAGQRAPHEEIHRNSIQRLVSYRGTGAVNCAKPGGVDHTYKAHGIISPDMISADMANESNLSLCWDVVPENTWHYPEARGSAQWYGVAFHSAAAEDITDEYVSFTD